MNEFLNQCKCACSGIGDTTFVMLPEPAETQKWNRESCTTEFGCAVYKGLNIPYGVGIEKVKRGPLRLENETALFSVLVI